MYEKLLKTEQIIGKNTLFTDVYISSGLLHSSIFPMFCDSQLIHIMLQQRSLNNPCIQKLTFPQTRVGKYYMRTRNVNLGTRIIIMEK